MAEGRNPWQVDSIEDFYVLKCPECAFFSKLENSFQDHAVKNHYLSHILFSESTLFNEHEFESDNISKTSAIFDQQELNIDQNELDADLIEFESCQNEFDVKQNEFHVDQNEFGEDSVSGKSSKSTENEIMLVEEFGSSEKNKSEHCKSDLYIESFLHVHERKKTYSRASKRSFSSSKLNKVHTETQAVSNNEDSLPIVEQKLSLDYDEFEDTMITNPIEKFSFKKEISEKNDTDVNIDFTTHVDEDNMKISKSEGSSSNPIRFEVQDFASIPTKILVSDCFSITPCSDNPIDVKIKEEISDFKLNNDAINISIENSSIKTEICEETKISDCDNTMSMLNTHINIKEEICDDTEPNDFIHNDVEEEYLENTTKNEIKSTELDDYITIPKKKYSEILKKHVELVLEQQKPHKCSVCNKRFDQKGNLRTHIWKKHSHVVSNESKKVFTDKPTEKHSCSLCFKSYPYMSVLKKHMKLAHDFSTEMVNLMEINLKETQIESAIKEILHQEDPLTIFDLKNCHEVESSSISNFNIEEDQTLLEKNEQKKDTFKCGYFKCPLCHTEFRYFDSLKIHIGRLHGAGKTKPKENYKECEVIFSLTNVNIPPNKQ